ncbi:MAG: radical SAM family heme chaperone HemW, partial [Bacteroidales bacterium]
MAGFYIHIPFCRKQCYYCDFHFTVSFKHLNKVIEAIKLEIIRRKKEFETVGFDTVYFGGGTPSILPVRELNSLFELIKMNFRLHSEPEITLEVNPDDLTKEYLRELRAKSPVNRLSIGVQSFDDHILRFLNRRHDSKAAVNSVKHAKKQGFENLNIDLIYGIPGTDVQAWNKNLELFGTLNIPHLSAYHLTIEPKTVFAYYRKKGKIKPVPEEESIRQFNLLTRFASENNYEHYEISNFAKRGFHSKHNLNYWNREAYIGIGPSAHSFDGRQRRWNVANNTKYYDSLLDHTDDYYESEELDKKTAFNEYLMTSLRTIGGIDGKYLAGHFGEEFSADFEKDIKRFVE